MPRSAGNQPEFDEDDDRLDNDQILDEGPSSEDIERLDHESALCPDCGAEIWDAAEICPKCFAYIGGNAVNRRPWPTWLRKVLVIVLAVGLIIITLLCFMSPAFNDARMPD
jgi:hypothetical protein